MATALTRPTDPPPPEGDILYEVVDGHLVEKPLLGAYEADIASLLGQILGSFVRAQGLGRIVSELLFLIDREKGLQRRPDLAFVPQDRWPITRQVPQTAAWDMVPELAIEVVSPTNTATEIMKKLDEYFLAGVKRAWVVYPLSRRIYIYNSTAKIEVREGDSALEDPELFPGFRLPLSELFFGQPE